jgi:alkanesulfonate monooxygenase SsuD/methylene tetrahydromethanopterin reductase-like flavin-dependent oxidoreductase (luciferase family)
MNSAVDPMRFGWLADQRLAWNALADTARSVERLGYDSLWMSDHFRDERGGWLLDAWTSLGATLACVPRIEAGLLVASDTLRPSLVTVQMAKTLTEIGAGRFVLGLGAGGSRRDHLAAGVDFPPLDDRVAALESTCRLLRSTHARDTAGTAGRSAWHRDDSPVTLLLGGASGAILRLAGRYADRWVVWGSPDKLAALGAEVSRHARDAGREPRDVRRGAIVMLLPEHLSECADSSPWPAELRGGRVLVERQVARYRAAGVHDLVVCDYGLQPADRPAALKWFAAVMAPFQEPSSQ